MRGLVILEPLGSVTLKGRAETVKAYRVESLERPVGTATAVFVGRDDELGGRLVLHLRQIFPFGRRRPHLLSGRLEARTAFVAGTPASRASSQC